MMVDRTDLLLNCRPFYWANFSLRAAGQPQPCTGARVRLGLSSFQTRNCRELPTFINPIQVRRVSVFCIWSFMNQTSRAAQAGRQPSRTPGPESQSPRHEAARNRCHVSGRLPLALRRASACPSGYENPPGRSAQGTQQHRTHSTAARSSSGVRVEKGRPSNATHPRTHFPLLALFGYPSILRVSLAQTSRCLCCSALGRNWPPSRFWRVSTAREQRQPMSFPSCRPVTLSPPPNY